LQCPTTIVPFFGDQPFWGDQVHARKLGPATIPVDQFGLQKLVDAIKFMMEPEVSSAIFMVYVVQGVQNLLPFHPFEYIMQI
jgi:UDP:flavonoid glycosyltransferase YjiC (YdhE family)